MNPSHTGAARYCEGHTSGHTSIAAPTTISARSIPANFFPLALALALGARARRVLTMTTAINSAASKIAGQMVANDHA
jgi:hypothetical protein